MFEEKSFKVRYAAAYDRIVPDRNWMEGLEERAGDRRRQGWKAFSAVMRPVAATLAVVCLLGAVALPGAAKEYPRIYRIVRRYAPALEDYVLPVCLESTSHGITMQVEAVKVEDRRAEIILSLTDEGEDNDLIRGEVFLERYSLENYDTSYNIGGHSFLEYDEAEDKAYFKIQLTTMSDRPADGKLTLGVHGLLTDCREYTRWIALEDVIMEPPTRVATISGRGGDWDDFREYMGRSQEEPHRPAAEVMDIPRGNGVQGEGEDAVNLRESLAVTAVGFSEGVLRVQFCRGNLDHADRHMRLFLVDEEGREQLPGCHVSWHEDVDGESVFFEEQWFSVEESELESLRMYGIYSVTDGSVEGDWEVTFKASSYPSDTF